MIGFWYNVPVITREVERPSGKIVYIDNGIRSHGSVDYNSILRRYSHGCHRLYNHLAIRLFDFILRHRPFNRLGKLSAGYSRKVEIDDEIFFINLDSRGYRYELVNAMPIEVLRGRVRGKQRSPIEHHMPKPGVEYGPDAQFLPPDWDPREDSDAGVESDRSDESSDKSDDGSDGSDGSDRSSDKSDGSDRSSDTSDGSDKSSDTSDKSDQTG